MHEVGYAKTLPLISIIVPLYNGSSYIDRLLDNFSTQTFQDFEVLFIDDQSQDTTVLKLQSHLETMSLPQYRLIENKQNLGISRTKNKAIPLASGDYIMFLDQDDYLSKNALELLVEKVKDGCDYVVGSYVREYTYKRKFYDKLFEFQKQMEEHAGAKLEAMKPLLTTIHQALWAKLYHRSFFTNFQFDENLHGVEDLGATSILLAKANKIGVVSDVIYHYQYAKESTINNAESTYLVEDTYKAYNNFYDYYQNAGITSVYNDELEYLYIYHCVLSVMVRTYQRIEHFDGAIKIVYQSLDQRFPKYRKNKYYRKQLFVSKFFIELNRLSIVRTIVAKILYNKTK